MCASRADLSASASTLSAPSGSSRTRGGSDATTARLRACKAAGGIAAPRSAPTRRTNLQGEGKGEVEMEMVVEMYERRTYCTYGC